MTKEIEERLSRLKVSEAFKRKLCDEQIAVDIFRAIDSIEYVLDLVQREAVNEGNHERIAGELLMMRREHEAFLLFSKVGEEIHLERQKQLNKSK